jgi:hypothetical protein
MKIVKPKIIQNYSLIKNLEFTINQLFKISNICNISPQMCNANCYFQGQLEARLKPTYDQSIFL